MRVIPLIGLLIFISFVISGCSTAGHAAKMGPDKGLEAMCAGGCLEYNEDATGCAVFHESTSQSCANYFEVLCKAAPGQCVNNRSIQ